MNHDDDGYYDDDDDSAASKGEKGMKKVVAPLDKRNVFVMDEFA